MKHVVIPLPSDVKDVLERAILEPSLRDPYKIGHVFTHETVAMLNIGDDGLMTDIEIKSFCEMVSRKGCAFAFTIDEIGCVNPLEVTLMITFIVPHLP